MGDLRSVVQQYRTASLMREGARSSDGQMVEDYVVRQDPSAFEAILQLHGPMIFGVCQRLLRNQQDAEDAFQATFLVLIKSARSIAKQTSIASWLFGVATRVSLKLREANRKRQQRELVAKERRTRAQNDRIDWAEIEPIFDTELAGLPTKYREVLILCELEGRSYREAARRLKTTERAISMRLLRAKEQFARRLRRRGVQLTAGALSILITDHIASANVPSSLIGATFQVAKSDGSVTATPTITRLVEGVLKTMFISKIKTNIVISALLALLGTGIGGVALQLQGAPPQAQANKEAETPDLDPPPKQDEGLLALHQELLDVARQGYDRAIRLTKNGRLLQIDEPANWSLRMLESEQAISQDRKQRIAAVESHLARMKELEEIVHNGGSTFAPLALKAKYYRLEAQKLVRQLR